MIPVEVAVISTKRPHNKTTPIKVRHVLGLLALLLASFQLLSLANQRNSDWWVALLLATDNDRSAIMDSHIGEINNENLPRSLVGGSGSGSGSYTETATSSANTQSSTMQTPSHTPTQTPTTNVPTQTPTRVPTHTPATTNTPTSDVTTQPPSPQPKNTTRPTALPTTTSPYAYAFLMGGANPDHFGSYRGYLYNILIATQILRERGSTADIVVWCQLTCHTNATSLPAVHEQWLSRANIYLRYIPKNQMESFIDIVMEKFRILSMVEYKRVLFLDSDLLPLGNLDYFFTLSDPNHHAATTNVTTTTNHPPAPMLKENVIVQQICSIANRVINLRLTNSRFAASRTEQSTLRSPTETRQQFQA